VIINLYWSSCQVPLFLSYFQETWIYSTDFLEISSFLKRVRWKSNYSMRTDRQKTDGQTWRCEWPLISIFRTHLKTFHSSVIWFRVNCCIGTIFSEDFLACILKVEQVFRNAGTYIYKPALRLNPKDRNFYQRCCHILIVWTFLRI
jgi:hypothetical protein